MFFFNYNGHEAGVTHYSSVTALAAAAWSLRIKPVHHFTSCSSINSECTSSSSSNCNPLFFPPSESHHPVSGMTPKTANNFQNKSTNIQYDDNPKGSASCVCARARVFVKRAFFFCKSLHDIISLLQVSRRVWKTCAREASPQRPRGNKPRPDCTYQHCHNPNRKPPVLVSE